MSEILFIGFKGKNNTSSALAKSISADSYLLTNSFVGLKRDIDLLSTSYSCIILFGIDKNLIHTVRIESIAKKETEIVSALNLRTISSQLNDVGVVNFISNKPTSYLCNEAYWHLLRKFHGNAVLIHIPSSKNTSETLMEKLRMVFTTYLTDK